MVEKRARKMQRVGSSDCRSWCSDQYPSGQFKKVSIGILSENPSKMGSLARKEDGDAVSENPSKMGSLARKEDGDAVPGRGGASYFAGKDVKENEEPLIEEIRKPEIVETLEVKQVEDKGQKASEWITSRSVRHETPTTESVQLYMNRASIVQSEDGAQKKLDTVVYRKRQEKGETVGKMEKVVEELAFATLQEGQVSDKVAGREKTEKVSTCKNETLRMKLWEILGTAPSQIKQTVNLLNPEEKNDNLNINHYSEYHRSKVSQPKHNSDTIETDSESPNQIERRPITRSSTRRRAPPKTVSKLLGAINGRKKLLSPSNSDSKKNLKEKNIFAFDVDGKTEVLERTVAGHSNKTSGRMNEEKNAGSGRQKILQSRSLGSQKGLKPHQKGKIPPSPEEASLYSKEAEVSPSPPSEDKTDSMETPQIQNKARRSPCSSKQILPEKKRQSYDRETTVPLPDRHSLQSQETEGSSKIHQAEKEFVHISVLQKKDDTEGKRISSNRRVISEKNFQPSEREQTLPSPDRASVESEEVPDDSHHSPTDACKDFGDIPDADNDEIDDSPLPRNKTNSREHVLSPLMSNNSYPHRHVSNLPLKLKTNILDDFPSPTFAMNTSPPSPSLGRLPNDRFNSPKLTQDVQERNPTGNDYSSKMFSRPGFYGSDANTESSDGSRKHVLQGTEFPYVKEKEARNKSTVFPVEDQETGSSGADDFIRKGFKRTDKWFPLDAGSPENFASTFPQSKGVIHGKSAVPSPGAGCPNKSSHTLYRSKRVKGVKNIELEESTGLFKASEQYPENSLESDVIELALVLERFKAKLKSHTSEKSSEILSAAADKIRLQLNDLESQMQADVGKFINSGKSKRKRFESRLQGQQERLRLLHDKFKEEINLQIQDCRSTLEELEAHRIELKGSTDRQKASYRKLLLQVEEAMKSELRDAETNIAAIDKEAKKKMYGLKYVLKEWMEDGVIR